jgi:hypothetical protein
MVSQGKVNETPPISSNKLGMVVNVSNPNYAEGIGRRIAV